jgi:hypothetical protein
VPDGLLPECLRPSMHFSLKKVSTLSHYETQLAVAATSRICYSLRMAKKIGFSIFLTLILLVAFHKALAADLPALPPLASPVKNRIHFDCANLHSTVRDLDDRMVSEIGSVSDYFTSAAQYYSNWHAELSALEGKKVTWVAGQFAPLSESEKNIDVTSKSIYAMGERYDDAVTSLQEAVEKCVADSPEREAALEQLQKFIDMNTENISTIADFASQMHGDLKSWSGVWRAIEGQELAVPQDYFIELQNGSGTFSEAAELVTANTGLVLTEYRHFVEVLTPLALPLAP